MTGDVGESQVMSVNHRLDRGLNVQSFRFRDWRDRPETSKSKQVADGLQKGRLVDICVVDSC